MGAIIDPMIEDGVTIRMQLKSILLVDDEATLLDLFSVALRPLPNPILRATGGMEALTILDKDRPSVVVLDLAMPDVDGMQVLESIRNNPKLTHTKVIILTAVPVMIDYQVVKLADEVLTKPIGMHALRQAVQAHLEPQ
ncbi:MAG: response regulator [Anaerolineae bacterium]|nr:response regulator [Anaerolineae bacterium]